MLWTTLTPHSPGAFIVGRADCETYGDPIGGAGVKSGNWCLAIKVLSGIAEPQSRGDVSDLALFSTLPSPSRFPVGRVLVSLATGTKTLPSSWRSSGFPARGGSNGQSEASG